MLNEQIQAISSLGTFAGCMIIIVILILLNQFNLALTFFLSIAAIMFVCGISKFFFFKQRPDKQKFNSWLEKIDASSFPSAHAARAMSLLVILGLYFKSLYWWIFLGILTLSIGLSRIWLKRHRVIDIIAGFILGFVISLIIYKLIV